MLARTRAVVLLPFTFVLNLTLSNKLFSYFPRSVTVWACSQLGKAPPVTNNCWQNVTESPGSGFVFPVDVWILHWRWVIHTTCWFSLLYRSSGLVWVFNPESIWTENGNGWCAVDRWFCVCNLIVDGAGLHKMMWMVGEYYTISVIIGFFFVLVLDKCNGNSISIYFW